MNGQMKITMKFAKCFIATCLLLVSHMSFAGATTPAGQITKIGLYDGHTGILITHAYLMDPDQCGRQDIYILPQTHPHYKEAYSLLLAAQMAGKKVELTISGCHQGIPAIKHIYLPQ